MVVEFSDGSLYENVGQLQWVFLRCLGILTPLLLHAPQSIMAARRKKSNFVLRMDTFIELKIVKSEMSRSRLTSRYIYLVVGNVGVDVEDFEDILFGEALGDGTLVADGVVVQQQQLATIVEGEVEVVDDNENGFVLGAVDVAQQFHNFELMGYVEVGNGFVEQHDRCLLGEGTSQHHTLQFAAAHLVWERKAQMPGVGLFHALFHDVPVGLRLVL